MPVTHVKLGTRVVFRPLIWSALMRFSRARYVTLCQQSLVTAAVLAVGVSAAGVKTLDIVPPPGPIAGVGDVPAPPAEDALTRSGDGPAARTEVDTTPVTPKVREIQVRGT